MKIAALIQPNINKKIDTLYQSFLRLNEHEQCVLMILAVVYKPIGIKKLDEIINKLVDTGFLLAKKSNYRLSVQRKEQLASSHY